MPNAPCPARANAPCPARAFFPMPCLANAQCPTPYVTEKGYSIISVKDLITKNILDNWQKNT